MTIEGILLKLAKIISPYIWKKMSLKERGERCVIRNWTIRRSMCYLERFFIHVCQWTDCTLDIGDYQFLCDCLAPRRWFVHFICYTWVNLFLKVFCVKNIIFHIYIFLLKCDHILGRNTMMVLEHSSNYCLGTMNHNSCTIGNSG